MGISKTWDWEKNINKEWLEPSMESYYFANIWKKEGKTRVLDLGCGVGRHSMLFYDYGFKVTACDITPYAINYLKSWQEKRNISFPVIECDMLNMPFKNNSFDSIYAYHVLSHTNLEGFKKLFDKIYDILDTNGEIYFDVLSKKCFLYSESGYPKIDSNTILSQAENEMDVPHICFDYNELIDILKKFEIVNIKEVHQYDKTKMDNNEIHFYIHLRKK